MFKDLKLFLALLGPYKMRVRFALLVGGVAGLCTGAGITLGAEKLFSIVLNGEQSIELKRLILVASIFPLLLALALVGGGVDQVLIYKRRLLGQRLYCLKRV